MAEKIETIESFVVSNGRGQSWIERRSLFLSFRIQFDFIPREVQPVTR